MKRAPDAFKANGLSVADNRRFGRGPARAPKEYLPLEAVSLVVKGLLKVNEQPPNA